MGKLEEREEKVAASKRKSFVQAAMSKPPEEVIEKTNAPTEDKVTTKPEEKKEKTVVPNRAKNRVVIRKVKETGEDEKMKQYSCYLPLKLQKAIIIKTAEGELDKSGVMREALRMYLADILAAID